MRQLVLVLAVVAASLVATPAFAQRGEASVLVGWTFSDGVTGDSILAGDGNRYDRVDPKDSFKWGFDVGAYTSDNVQVGFLFGQQMSKLTFGGTNTVEVGDLKINTYHGYFAYNFGERDAATQAINYRPGRSEAERRAPGGTAVCRPWVPDLRRCAPCPMTMLNAGKPARR